MGTFIKHLYKTRFFLIAVGYVGFYILIFPVKSVLFNYIGTFVLLVAMMLIVLEIVRAARNAFKADQ